MASKFAISIMVIVSFLFAIEAKSGTLYSYKKDGVIHYSTKQPPAGVPFKTIDYESRAVVRTPQSIKEAEAKSAAASAAAKAYIDDMYRRGAEEAERERAIAAQRASSERQLAEQQEQIELQREQLEELKKTQRQQALQQTLRAINQDWQSAAQQTNQPYQYPAPKVEQQTLYSPPIVHCRTIGSITTCN